MTARERQGDSSRGKGQAHEFLEYQNLFLGCVMSQAVKCVRVYVCVCVHVYVCVCIERRCGGIADLNF